MKHLQKIDHVLTEKEVFLACENRPYVGVGTDGIQYTPENDRLIITSNEQTEFWFDEPGDLKIAIPSYIPDLWPITTSNIGYLMGNDLYIGIYWEDQDNTPQEGKDFEIYTYNNDGERFKCPSFGHSSYTHDNISMRGVHVRISMGASTVSTTLPYNKGICMIKYDIHIKTPGILFVIQGIPDQLSFKQCMDRCHYSLLDSAISVQGGEEKELLFSIYDLRKAYGLYFLWEGSSNATLYTIPIGSNVDITNTDYCKEYLTLTPGEVVNMYDLFTSKNVTSWLIHAKIVSESDGILKIQSPQQEPNTTLVTYGDVLQPGTVYAMFPTTMYDDVRFQSVDNQLFTINIYSSSSCTPDTLLMSETCSTDSYVPFKVSIESEDLDTLATNNTYKFIYVMVDSQSPTQVEVQTADKQDWYFVQHINEPLKLSSSKKTPKVPYAELYDKDILIDWTGSVKVTINILKPNKSTRLYTISIPKKSTYLIDKETINSWRETAVDDKGYLWLNISATYGTLTMTDQID